MVNREAVQFLANTLLFNPKGYISEQELKNEIANWRDVLEFTEQKLNSLGVYIKDFFFNEQKCFAITGSIGMYETILSDEEGFILIYFILYYEILNSKKNGLNYQKWKDKVIKKIGGKKKFEINIKKLMQKKFLKLKSNLIKPNWRYFVVLKIDSLIKEIKADVALGKIIETEEKGNLIFD